MVDGLGWELLREHPAAAPFLSELAIAGRALTAGFPATTVTSLTSLGTGLPPGEHGMLGYQVAVPGAGRLLNGLRWDERVDPLSWQPSPSIYQQAEAAGVAAYRVAAKALEKTGFSAAAMRGASYRAADTLGALVAQAAAALAGSDHCLVTVYHADLDSTGHAFGSQSEAWFYQLAHVDKLAEQLAGALPPGTTMYITADHGMVDSAPEEKIDVDELPVLRDGVALLGGEPRARHVYAEPGAAADVLIGLAGDAGRAGLGGNPGRGYRGGLVRPGRSALRRADRRRGGGAGRLVGHRGQQGGTAGVLTDRHARLADARGSVRPAAQRVQPLTPVVARIVIHRCAWKNSRAGDSSSTDSPGLSTGRTWQCGSIPVCNPRRAGGRETVADSLTDVTALAAALAGPRPPVLLDVRWRLTGPPGIDSYRAGHLPGARFVDLDRDLAAPPGAGAGIRCPPAGQFQDAMRRAGVRDGWPVVVYDEADSTAAARAWWLLRYFGHDRVRVLDGGYQAWLAAGQPVEAGPGSGDPAGGAAGAFTARPGQLPLLDAAAAAALARDSVLLDARAAERYQGAVEPVDPVAGHIPGAVSAPTTANVTRPGSSSTRPRCAPGSRPWASRIRARPRVRRRPACTAARG